MNTPSMTEHHRRDTPISGELLVMRERTLHLESNNTEATPVKTELWELAEVPWLPSFGFSDPKLGEELEQWTPVVF